MRLREKLAKRVILAIEPTAYDDGVMKQLDDHQRRIRTDPEIRARRERVRIQSNRENLPWFVALVCINALFAGVTYWVANMFNDSPLTSAAEAVAGFAIMVVLMKSVYLPGPDTRR